MKKGIVAGVLALGLLLSGCGNAGADTGSAASELHVEDVSAPEEQNGHEPAALPDLEFSFTPLEGISFMGDYVEGLAMCATRVGDLYRMGYADPDGQVVIDMQFERTWSFSEGLAAVLMDGKWGYIDTSGALVIPCQWDYAERFSEGLALVTLGERLCFIDPTGAVVLEPDVDLADHRSFLEGSRWNVIPTREHVFQQGYCFLEPNVFVGRDGQVLRMPETFGLTTGRPYLDGLYYYVSGARVGCVDMVSGEHLFERPGGSITRFSDTRDGVAIVDLGSHMELIDLQGRRIRRLPGRVKGLVGREFSDGLIPFYAEGMKYGYLDTGGEIAIPPVYDLVYPFHDGLAKVQLLVYEGREMISNDMLLIDTQGNVQLEGFFSHENNFSHNRIYAKNVEEDVYGLYRVVA